MARTKGEVLFGRTEDLPDPHPELGDSFNLMATPYPPRGAADQRAEVARFTRKRRAAPDRSRGAKKR
jgi:hypothetical protein